MSELDLASLKIETLQTAMKYATRDDFPKRRQKIIDGVHREVTRILREAQKPGALDARIDDDGDLAFFFETSSFHFVLESQAGLSGGTFRNLYDHALAFKILTCLHHQIIDTLELTDVDVFTVNFLNVFNIAERLRKNVAIFETKMMPALRATMTPLCDQAAEIGRVDFKIGWDYDARRTCYYSIECPTNDDNSTIWMRLDVRTREDILVSINQGQVDADIEKAHEIYCGPYANLLRKLLGDVDLDFAERKLIP